MDIHGDINLRQNRLVGAVFESVVNFPSQPRAGQVVFKDKILYICTEMVGGLPVWVPTIKPLEMVKHVQAVAAVEWVVPHSLNMNSVFVQVYDAAGNWVIPDYISISSVNSVVIGFNTPTAGTAIVMRGETDGAPQTVIAFEQAFTNLSTWVVAHQLGYNPITRVMVGTNEVQPQSIVHDSTMQLTVTFSAPQTGTVRCI